MNRLLIFLITLFCLSNLNAQSKISFTIKNSKNLPAWFENAERTYSLNDDRLVDYEQLKFIGGYDSKNGEIFFINNKEIVFGENQIKINEVKNIITKTFTSGDYFIKMIWDKTLTTGAYSEGTISLIYKNVAQFKSKLIISGW